MDFVKEIPSPAGGGGPQGRRGTRSVDANIARFMSTESPSALRAPPPAGEGFERATQREGVAALTVTRGA